MVQPEGEPGHGHRHGAGDVHLHIGHTVSGGTQETFHIGKLLLRYDCPQEVASNGGMQLVVSDGSLLDKCRWRQLVVMAAVVLALISFCALRNFFKGFPKVLISKLSNSDTDRDYEEG